MNRLLRLRPLAAMLLVVGAAGCGSALLEAAGHDDLEAFRTRLQERLKRGEVGVGEARSVAARLLEHHIETAHGLRGEQSLQSVASCAAEVDDALRSRARQDDELAARAAMLRVEAGRLPPMAYGGKVTSEAPHWRAVAARTLTLSAPEPGEQSSEARERRRAAQWRRRLLADPSALVRRAALKAAHAAADRGDASFVLEAARLDPDPEARLVAIEAAGAIGTREAVLSLKDLWATADETVRLAIVGAWAAAWRNPYRRDGTVPACDVAPGADAPPQGECEAYRQLWRASDLDEGLPSVVAAIELLHGHAPELAVTPERASLAANSAAALIERTIDESPARVRVEAIASAPLSWGHLVEAIVEASKSNDDRVVVAASARLAELGGKEATAALERLRKLAAADDVIAERARRALVALGDAQSADLLDHDAKAKSAVTRGLAAQGYARLGRVDKALALLGDQDARVRVTAGCSILGLD